MYGIDEGRSPTAVGWKLKLLACRKRAHTAQPLVQQISLNFFLASQRAGLCCVDGAPSYAATVSTGKPCTGVFWSLLSAFAVLSGQSQVIFHYPAEAHAAAPIETAVRAHLPVRNMPGAVGRPALRWRRAAGLRPRRPPGPWSRSPAGPRSRRQGAAGARCGRAWGAGARCSRCAVPGRACDRGVPTCLCACLSV